MAYWNQGGADFSNLTPALTPEQMGNNPEPEGFFESIPDALAAGSVNFGNAFWLGTVGTPAIAVDWVTSKLTGKETTQEQDIVFRDIIDPGIQYANSLGQQERSMAGSLTFGIGKVLTEFASGGAGAMAVSEFSSRATSEVLAGKSAFDANMLALNQAAFAYAGAALPGALGGSLLTKAASGSGINVATGITQRAVEKGILYSQDDARLADYKIFDPTEIVIDMVLGAAFGVLEPTRAGKKLDAPSDRAVDAAMLVDRARFEDAQIHVRTPEIEVRVERGINEQVRAMTEGRPFTPERLPDEVTMPDMIVGYHGTRDSFDAYDAALSNSSSMTGVPAGSVVFSTSPDAASSYANAYTVGEWDSPASATEWQSLFDSGKYMEANNFRLAHERQVIKYDAGGNVRKNALTPRNPLIVDAKGALWKKIEFEGEVLSTNDIAFIAKSRGYDSVIIKDVRDQAVMTEESMPADTIFMFDDSRIAAMFGIKPDPEMKAMQAEVDGFWRDQADPDAPIIEDIDPATITEMRTQAQAIEDAGMIVDDAEYLAAVDNVEQVRSIKDIMGCLLRIGV